MSAVPMTPAGPSTRSPSTLRRWAARHHPVVWWILVAKVTFTLCFSLLVPFFRGPDEVLHLSMLRWYGTSVGYTDPTVRLPVDPALLAIGVDPPRSPDQPFRPPLQEAAAPSRADRPTLDELSAAIADGTISGGSGEATNQLSQHPALFYVATNAVTGVVAGLVPSDVWSWDRQSLLYRWESVALSGVLPLLASAAALAAGLRRRAAAVAAAFVFLVPMHSFLGSVINSDSFVVLMASAGIAATVVFLGRGHQRRWALAAAGCVAVAVAAKSTALPVLPWMLAAVALPVWFAWRAGAPVRRHVATLAMAVGIAVVGASWQLANLVRFGKVQPSSYRLDVRDDVATSLGEFATTWPARLSVSFWGQPGRRTGVSLPEVVTGALSVATIVLMVVGLTAAWRQGRGRVVPTMLALLCVVQVALVFRTNWAGYFRGSGLEGFQGRYFFIVLVPMAVLVAMGVSALTGDATASLARRVSALRVAIGMAVTGWVLHAMVAERMIERYWGEPGASLASHVAAVRAWSPLPNLATVVVLWSPVMVAVAAVLTWLVRRLVRGPATRGSDGRRSDGRGSVGRGRGGVSQSGSPRDALPATPG